MRPLSSGQVFRHSRRLMPHIFDRVRITAPDRHHRRGWEERGARDREKVRYCACRLNRVTPHCQFRPECDSFTSKLFETNGCTGRRLKTAFTKSEIRVHEVYPFLPLDLRHMTFVISGSSASQVTGQ